MGKPNTIIALATFTAPELRADAKQLAHLQQGVIEQVKVMTRLRGEEALRGLLVGMTLLRIKASLPHGQFTPWIKGNLAWSERYCRYMMQLGLVFVEKTKAKKPEILALPGEQVELALDGMEGAQRQIFAKAQKFVGDLSLTELFEKHGLKEVKKLGGKRTAADDGEDAKEPVTPEQLTARAREDLAEWIATGRQLLLTDNVCQHLAPADIRSLDDGLKALCAEWRAAMKKTLKAE